MSIYAVTRFISVLRYIGNFLVAFVLGYFVGGGSLEMIKSLI